MASWIPSIGSGADGFGVRPPALPAWHSFFSSAPSLTVSTNWEWVPLVFFKINDIQSYKMYLSQPMFVYLWQLATICSGGDGIRPSVFGNIDFWKERVFKGPASQGRRADTWIGPGVSGEVGNRHVRHVRKEAHWAVYSLLLPLLFLHPLSSNHASVS